MMRREMARSMTEMCKGPHCRLVNRRCQTHRDTGWCLDCLKEEQPEVYAEETRLAFKAMGVVDLVCYQPTARPEGLGEGGEG